MRMPNGEKIRILFKKRRINNLGVRKNEEKLKQRTGIKGGDIERANPTFGRPTIPIFKDVPNRPRSTGDSSSFFGGIYLMNNCSNMTLPEVILNYFTPEHEDFLRLLKMPR